MSTLFFSIYRYVLAPVVFGLFQLTRPFLKGKLREIVEDKNQGFFKLQSNLSCEEIAKAQPYWVHAASGEIEYARPLIRELKRQYPDVPILVTYSSPSAKKILEGLVEVDAWASVPWDLPSYVQSFIEKWKPRVLLFSRTDVWPVLVTVATQQKIPSLLFSATFAENSSRLQGWTRYLTRYSLNQLSEIHSVSAEDIENLEALKLTTPVQISGDTRFDQVFHRLENPKPLKSSLIPSPEDFVFIAGSTWPEDENILVPALATLKTALLRVIIAPHEASPLHLQKLESMLQQAGLKTQRYSEAVTWSAADILIIDQVGILAELYTWADMAFIGGSFKKQVHSVMEALAAGLPVMVGPHHQNNREALFYQKKNYSSGMIVQVVHSAEDITVLVQRMKKKHLQMAQIKEEIRAEIGKNRHSTLRVLESLKKQP